MPKSIDYPKVIMTQVDYEYLLENYDIEVADNPSFLPYTVNYELMGLREPLLPTLSFRGRSFLGNVQTC